MAQIKREDKKYLCGIMNKWRRTKENDTQQEKRNA